MGRRWGMLLIGLGIGALAGLNVGRVLIIPGIVAIAVGAALLGLADGSPRNSGDLFEAGTTMSRADEKPSVERSGGPAGLGDRVTGILKLAEEQAADHRASAERDAARIIADARAEADRIRGGR